MTAREVRNCVEDSAGGAGIVDSAQFDLLDRAARASTYEIFLKRQCGFAFELDESVNAVVAHRQNA